MNLRDAMAEVIHQTKSPLHDHGEAVAQAIIQEFGLGVEHRGASGALPGEYRVVGEWRPEDPADAAVESSARALYAHVHRNMSGYRWETASSALRDEYRSMAVVAADGAAEAER